jgi:pimeloyl-ACP methyl ester carboxylesterase
MRRVTAKRLIAGSIGVSVEGFSLPPVRVDPFEIAVPDEVLEDLRRRIRSTRWPAPSPAPNWDQGTELAFLQGLLAHWAEDFDWRARERELNALAQFTTELGGARIHFVHERARSGDGIPLILTHGWPSAFVEYAALVPLLTNPGAHGIDGPAFDVVIPALPGYPFSERPHRTSLTTRHTAALWHELMQGLGYERYGTGGGDFGAGVATYMALDAPERVIALHLTNLELAPYLGDGARPLTDAERAYTQRIAQWDAVERGYSSIQSTKPQTVGYALTDSPAGLAAWIAEKWRSWTDSGGDPTARVGRDFLLTLLTLYWASGSVAETLRDYYDNRWFAEPLGPGDRVTVPTGFALFPHHHISESEPPREWVERVYDVRRFTRMARGGHFAPAEAPELVAADIAALFAEVA